MRRVVIFIGVGVALVTLAAFWLWPRTPVRPAAAPGAVRGAAPSQRPLLFAQAAVLLQGERSWRTHAGVPLVVDLVLRNPLGTVARLTVAADLAPRLRREDGSDVPATWIALPVPATEIAARDGVILGWILRDALPAGSYTVTVNLPKDVLTGQEPLDAPRVFDAPLDIVAGDPSAEERALAEARVLRRTGDTAGTLAALQKAAGPDASLVLRLWTADALREAGRTAEADAEYARLAAESMAAQRARGIASPEVPFWLTQAISR